MKNPIIFFLIVLLFSTTVKSQNLAGKKYIILAGTSIQTKPVNDSCYAKHYDILSFGDKEVEIYYRKTDICKTKSGRTKKSELRYMETKPYFCKNNEVFIPGTSHDSLQIKGRRLKNHYGNRYKPLSHLE